MRCSSIACSFLASSYSEFSVISPNSRASLMRAATSRRFSPERRSSSSLSLSRPSWVRMTSRGMGARHGSNEQLPGLERAGRPLERLVERLVAAKTLHVPGISLAQPARGPGLSEVLDRPLDQPIELGPDLFGRRLVLAEPEQLLEQPRVAQRPAREH